MTDLPNGIYLGMAEDDYLAIERLSKSGIKKVRVSAADFWHDSWLNPHKPELTPEQERRKHIARVMGRAYHCARLEPDRFERQYVSEPSKTDAPEGTLFTLDAMKDVIRELNKEREKPDQLKLGGSTMEVALRLADDSHDRAKLWHLIMSDWEASLPDDAIRLDANSYAEIVEDGRRLRAAGNVSDLLTGGFSEVSILYTCPDTKIPMKARLDYLKGDAWAELKTFSNPNGKHLEQCVMDAIRYNRYYLDAACYFEAIQALQGELDLFWDKEVVPDGEVARFTKMLEELRARSSPPDLHFVFQQTGGVPNVLDRKWRFFEPNRSEEAIADLERDGATEDHLKRARHMQSISDNRPVATAIHTKARVEIKRAKEDFISYSEMYPAGDPWLPFDPSREITDADFHPNWLEEIQ